MYKPYLEWLNLVFAILNTELEDVEAAELPCWDWYSCWSVEMPVIQAISEWQNENHKRLDLPLIDLKAVQYDH